MPRKRTPKPQIIPANVAQVNAEIAHFFGLRDDVGKRIGSYKYGIYTFYDYDGEPIYVGQTAEQIRARVGRHLTNQRTDAVAMSVLDPLEVAEIEVWPLNLDDLSTKSDRTDFLRRAEFTVLQRVLAGSSLNTVLNEKDIPRSELVELPKSYRARIVPESLYENLKHPDIRLAQRASTVASLARIISQRDVSPGLRRTLLTQARRLEMLAKARLQEVGGEMPIERAGEETGEKLE